MNYKIFRFDFGHHPVHLGAGSLEDNGMSLCADTLFAALCTEAAASGEKGVLEDLVSSAKSGQLVLSDAFPYFSCGKDTAQFEYLIPKPLRYKDPADSTRDDIKRLKKVQYIPVSQLAPFLCGNAAWPNDKEEEDRYKSGMSSIEVHAAIRGEEKTLPYRIGAYTFRKGCGLYIIVGFEDETCEKLIERLLTSLSFSGIGGKRKVGKGKFKLFSDSVPSDLERLLSLNGNECMTLSVALPKEDELDSALDGAAYTLLRRGGFVTSLEYSGTYRRKKDLYVFSSGSCFSHRFSGGVYDVGTKEGSHPVYRYAQPMFIGLPREER